MSILNPQTFVVFLVAVVFLMGMATFVAGVLILTLRASNGDVKTLAVQTAQLVQKGLAEDMVGLIGNATDLMDAMNQLVRTTRGVGMFLTLLGMVMMGAACWVAIQVYKMGL